ncbi:TA system VapC family ribonuclease toxin [Amycolatopsis taiwanensis]|uniref:TA system VapC family ribonuclease toxin n=1 Tax=Amycolatopsis taiwanensis TaxID=342230 RepID=UPI0004821747|nr:TA system VapC family ribonuclease toxin [Amycolatopsis taiwanensis]
MTYLLDVNVLIDAVNPHSDRHDQVRDWLDDKLAGPPRTVGMPWLSVFGFVRITTNGRIFSLPASVRESWSRVTDWLDQPAAWIPAPTPEHRDLFGKFLEVHELTSALVTDVHLTALATEHGLTLVSADRRLDRFAQAGLVRLLDPSAQTGHA